MAHYGTLQQALDYHDARGNDAWAAAASDELRTAALLRASVWLDATYRGRFTGLKTGRRAQEREWPREGAWDSYGDSYATDEFPVEVLNATFEAALRELATPGYLSPDFIAADRVTSERVGPIAVTYNDNIVVDDVRPVVTLVDDIMSPLVGRSGPSLFGCAERA